MSSEVKVLVEDVGKKLADLCYLHDHQAYFLSEYFYDVRNSIDLDTEHLLLKHERRANKESNEKIATINAARSRLIQALNKEEEKLKNRIPPAASNSNEAYASLKQRVEEFAVASDVDINELEDAYTQLALEILDETRQLQKSILDNHSIFYMPTYKGELNGNVFVLDDHFLSKVEIQSVLSNAIAKKECKFRWFYQNIENSLSYSMAVGVSRPFIFTRNMWAMKLLLQFPRVFRNTSGKVFCFRELPTESEQTISFDKPTHVYGSMKNLSAELTWREEALEAFDTAENPLKHICLDTATRSVRLDRNRLKSLDSTLMPLAEGIRRLDLSENQLESLDEEFIAKCEQLEELLMLRACLPDTKFSLEFLAPLRSLQNLHMTLPDISFDIGAFKHLSQLVSLHLESAASLDANKKRPPLSNGDFRQLSELEFLRELLLSFFEIGALEEDSLLCLENLKSITLNNNCISNCFQANSFGSWSSPELHKLQMDHHHMTRLRASKFSKFRKLFVIKMDSGRISSLNEDCLRGLDKLTILSLKSNRIVDLPAGLFDGIRGLKELHLSNNSIQRIRKGLFNSQILASLNTIALDSNPIEVIEDDAFQHLISMKYLTLSGCRLISINNRMFNGLSWLEFLDLSNNQIDTVKVKIQNRAISVVSSTKANMTRSDLEIVRQTMFHGLQVKKLSLKENRFEKMDLNVFCNIRLLEELDLSCNKIDELNLEAYDGTLTQLKTLNLNQNQLTSISRQAFGQSTHLEKLDLSDNHLQSLEDAFFVPFRGLTYINLKNNRLDMTITQRTFGGNVPDLETLNLLGNEKLRVEDEAFARNTKLGSLHLALTTCSLGIGNVSTLILDNSQSDVIQRFLTAGEHREAFEKAQELSISCCSLETLDGFELGRFWMISKLDFSKNQFATFKSIWLEGLDTLNELDLSDNLIETLDDPELFRYVPKLCQLSLKGNKLQHVNRRLFKGLSWLSSLDLSNNQLSDIDYGLFRGLISLDKLNIADNNISSFNLAKLFHQCRTLKCLDLANNQLDHESVNEAAMSHNTYLTELNLSNNRLVNMDFVRNLIRLQRLDLSRNQIESVEKDGFNLLGRLLELTHLDLSGNQIRSLRMEMFAHLDHQLLKLDLSCNPADFSFLNEFKMKG